MYMGKNRKKEEIRRMEGEEKGS
jgi:hypothetical protein